MTGDNSQDETPDGGLSKRIERARARVPMQYNPVLYQEMSEREIDQERDLYKWERARKRRQRKRALRRELAAESRDLQAARRAKRRADREKRWHAEALAARQRATNPDAQVGLVHRQTMVMSRNLGVAVVGGLAWSAVNVGRNLMPDGSGPSGPTWWALWVLSFGVEGLISIPIREIMKLATTSARNGRQLDRSRIVLFEAALLLVTVGLNAGPHLADGDWGRAAEYSVAPVMVVVCMWLHAWLSNRYAKLIDSLVPAAASGSDSATPASATAAVATGNVTPVGSVLPLPTASVPLADTGAVGSMPTAVQRPGESDSAPGEVPTETLSGWLHQGILLRARIENPAADECELIARHLVKHGQCKLREDHLVTVLRLAEDGVNPNAIATQMSQDNPGFTFTRSAVDRAITRAGALRNSAAQIQPEEVAATAHSA
ncbi:hypothetical protein [Nocardia terpenica]|uniref:DUF2637 domain-containing protein n=1 Tax=Nocardia terpenica TaxID=455432 RepID=A0A6G9ZDN2_9NOCA|nr:hypothetical protein [Nocardia terpenica]QIS23729.1 hypothetical protein F6W96_41055 [Nocardia terpenica]